MNIKAFAPLLAENEHCPGCYESLVASVRFDTRDKKPKIWNVAVISAAAVIAVAVLAAMSGKRYITAISLILEAYYVCVIIMLITAFFRQLQIIRIRIT